MSVVIWSTAASQDIGRHFDFLNARNPDAAVRAVSAIMEAGDSLERNAYRGTVIDEVTGLRKLVVPFGKFGFVIHYQIVEGGDSIIIAKVYHGRENRPY